MFNQSLQAIKRVYLTQTWREQNFGMNIIVSVFSTKIRLSFSDNLTHRICWLWTCDFLHTGLCLWNVYKPKSGKELWSEKEEEGKRYRMNEDNIWLNYITVSESEPKGCKSYELIFTKEANNSGGQLNHGNMLNWSCAVMDIIHLFSRIHWPWKAEQRKEEREGWSGKVYEHVK